MKPETLAELEQHEECGLEHKDYAHCCRHTYGHPRWPCRDAELLAYIRELEAAVQAGVELAALAKVAQGKAIAAGAPVHNEWATRIAGFEAALATLDASQ